MSFEYCDLYNGMFSEIRSMHRGERPPPAVPWRECNKEEAIQTVRKLVRSQLKRPMTLPSFSDDFIMRFLLARKMNAENAFQLMVNYSDFRRNNPKLFDNLKICDEDIQDALRDGLPLLLKNYDRKGRRVLLLPLHQWDVGEHSIETIYRSLVLTMEYLLRDVQNQCQGFVFIVDWTNFTLLDYILRSSKMVKLMIDGFQDSFPARIKGVHFVGQPWYIEGFLTMIRPFIKEKTRQKLVIHGTNLSTLHEYVPRDVVPSDLGGEGSAFRPDELIEMLKEPEKL